MREWDENNKIKFYNRGALKRIKYNKNGSIKKPRFETQIYLNGKYFLQVPYTCDENGKEVIFKVIYLLYRCGADWEEIKRLCKLCFYKNTR